MTEEPHHSWIADTLDAYIIAAHCDCMAGLGETCSHVAAVLFKVEAAVCMGYISSAFTDEPCRWYECFVKKKRPFQESNSIRRMLRNGCLKQRRLWTKELYQPVHICPTVEDTLLRPVL